MKKWFSNVAAILVAAIACAFTMPHHQKPNALVRQWYDFYGDATQYTQLELYDPDPDNYPDCPNLGSVRCEVFAYPLTSGPYEGKPDLQQPFQERYNEY